MAGFLTNFAVGLVGGVESSIASKFDRAGKNIAIKLIGGRSSFLGSLLSATFQAGAKEERLGAALGKRLAGRRRRKGKRWAANHQVWLAANQWRFNWRSQPRRPAGTEVGGEWMAGKRLSVAAPISGMYLSRRERQKRMRAVKAFKGRLIARRGSLPRHMITSSWANR